MDVALPLPPDTAPAVNEPTRPDPRILGLAIGGAVPALVASAAWWMTLPWVAAIAAAGTLVGGLIGALMGRRVVEHGWAGPSFVAAVVAPLVPAAVIAVVFLVTGSGSSVEGSQQNFVSWLAVSAGVVLYSELLGVPVTLPLAITVAVLVRRAYRMPARRARVHVGLLVTVAVVAGTMTLLGIAGLLAPFGVHGFFDAGY